MLSCCNIVVKKSVHNSGGFLGINLYAVVASVVQNNIVILVCNVVIGVRFVILAACNKVIVSGSHLSYGNASGKTAKRKTAQIYAVLLRVKVFKSEAVCGFVIAVRNSCQIKNSYGNGVR